MSATARSGEILHFVSVTLQGSATEWSQSEERWLTEEGEDFQLIQESNVPTTQVVDRISPALERALSRRNGGVIDITIEPMADPPKDCDWPEMEKVIQDQPHVIETVKMMLGARISMLWGGKLHWSIGDVEDGYVFRP